MIKINDNYYVDSDSMQYILIKKNIVKKEGTKNYGQEAFKNIGYYGTIEALKSALLEKELKDNIDLLNNIDEVIKIKEEILKVGE